MVLEASGGYHDDVYMRVQGDKDRVSFVTQSNARQVMSYCTFDSLNHVEGEAEAIVPVGLDADTKGWLDYLGIADGGDSTEIALLGEEGDGDHPRLAERWSARGGLTATIRLPASKSDLSKVPWGLPKRWSSDDRYVSQRGLDDNGDIEDDSIVPSTVIETTADTVRQSIIEPAEFLDDVNYYPIVVDDGDLTLNLQGQDGDDSISGTVRAESVSGPDVERSFDEGFQEVFENVSGPVRLATAPAPDDADANAPPLTVVQNHSNAQTIRHVLGPFGG